MFLTGVAAYLTVNRTNQFMTVELPLHTVCSRCCEVALYQRVIESVQQPICDTPLVCRSVVNGTVATNQCTPCTQKMTKVLLLVQFGGRNMHVISL